MDRIDRSLSTKVLQNLNANQIANLKAMNAKLKQKAHTNKNEANKENMGQMHSREPREQVKLFRVQGHEPYLPTILKHLYVTSKKNIPVLDPFDHQQEINRRMRSILFNWLMEVQFKFELKTRTIFLASNIFDRFLQHQQVSKDKLQLVGITSFWMASKYEDIYPPELRELVHLCDQIYTEKEILDCENQILGYLNFDFVYVSSLDVHEVLNKLRVGEEKKIDQATQLVLHVFLFHSCVSKFGAFTITEFARYMAMKLLGVTPYDKGELTTDQITVLEEEFVNLVEAIRKDNLVTLEAKYKSLFFKLMYSMFN